MMSTMKRELYTFSLPAALSWGIYIYIQYICCSVSLEGNWVQFDHSCMIMLN